MFGLLKKKINSFISSIVQKEEEKTPEPIQVEEKQESQEPAAPEEKPKQPAPIPAEEKPQSPKEEKFEPTLQKEKPEPISKEERPKVLELFVSEELSEPATPAQIQEKPKFVPPEKPQETKPIYEKPKPVSAEKPKPETKPIPKLKSETGRASPAYPKPIEKPPVFVPQKREIEKTTELPKPSAREEEERKLSVRLSLGTRLKSFISQDVEIKEGDVESLLEGLNLSLLESDVAFEVSEHIVAEMRKKLVGMRVPKGSVDASVKSAMRASLLEVLSGDGVDIMQSVKEKPKPVKILLIGPNGAGKTTTMAKLARALMDSGHSCVFSASDTFRAAAIEQAEKHGEKLGVQVIKHKYGADPAAVAFDAVNYARAHHIEVVLIDSAGRQETNRNLVEEMKKISRVIQPDLKIFIGESIAGNAIISQVKSFSEAVGLDGVILTKLDCDAKGGTALSLYKATGVPILYFGVGQSYKDLVPFSPEYVVEQILG